MGWYQQLGTPLRMSPWATLPSRRLRLSEAQDSVQSLLNCVPESRSASLAGLPAAASCLHQSVCLSALLQDLSASCCSLGGVHISFSYSSA